MLKLVSYGRRLRVVFSMVNYSAVRQKALDLYLLSWRVGNYISAKLFMCYGGLC